MHTATKYLPKIHNISLQYNKEKKIDWKKINALIKIM